MPIKNYVNTEHLIRVKSSTVVCSNEIVIVAFAAPHKTEDN